MGDHGFSTEVFLVFLFPMGTMNMMLVIHVDHIISSQCGFKFEGFLFIQVVIMVLTVKVKWIIKPF